MRIPKRDLTLEPGGKLTFEVYINNSTENGGDRYEVVSAFGDPDAGFNSDASFRDSVKLILSRMKRTPDILNHHLDGIGRHHHAERTRQCDENGKRRRRSPLPLTPDHGKIVDTVTVDGEAVTLSADDNTFSLTCQR